MTDDLRKDLPASVLEEAFGYDEAPRNRTNPRAESKQRRSEKLPPMHSWDQMKPRTVYEKAVQDFTETARRLARLNQHFRQASFAEFEMLMGLDDEVLRRYGLPKQMIEQALREAYQTVVLDQERSTGANYI
jgi:multidrug efflux pump subunit AcrB